MQTSTTTVQTSGNITANSMAFSFDEESFGTLMTLLSNLYSSKNEAVIREYSANAYDSHVSAGQTRPIEVTLPTLLQPTFLVQDYGLGLSKEDVERVYIRYGKSTKRGTNELIGGFGIGCKAAFALGHQFVVTSVKDGVKVVYLFALNEENIGTATVISEGPTTEHNGVLVSLAVDDPEEFSREAHVFFSKWETGTVLVDGRLPENIFESALRVTERAIVVPDFEGAVFLRLGQVSYPVSTGILSKVANRLRSQGLAESAQTVEELTRWYNSSALFLQGEIGSAEIAPSRESLVDSEQTISGLVGLLEDLGGALERVVQQRISAAGSAVEAAALLTEAIENLAPLKIRRESITYRGIPLPAQAQVEIPAIVLTKKSHRCTNKIVEWRDEVRVAPKDLEKVIVVKGLSESERSSVKRFAKTFLEASDLSTIIVPEEGEEWGADPTSWFAWGTESAGIPIIDHAEFKSRVRGIRQSTPNVQRDKEPRYSLNDWHYEREAYERTPLSDIIEEGRDLLVFVGSTQLIDLRLDVARARYNWINLGPAQTKEALAKRLEGTPIKIVTDAEFAEAVREHAKGLLNPTDAERAALGARRWLDANADDIRRYKRLSRLPLPGEITNAVLLDVLNDIALVELVAEDISSARISELETAYRVLSSGRGTLDDEASFDAVLPSFRETFPLLYSKFDVTYTRDEDLLADVLKYLNA